MIPVEIFQWLSFKEFIIKTCSDPGYIVVKRYIRTLKYFLET